jgi:hypothetical protein
MTTNISLHITLHILLFISYSSYLTSGCWSPTMAGIPIFNMCVYICIFEYAYISLYVYTCIYVNICIYIHIYVCIYTCMFTYIYIHTYIFTYIYVGVFFVTRMDGVVDIWDYFYRQNEVAYSHKVMSLVHTYMWYLYLVCCQPWSIQDKHNVEWFYY